jgi:hypothetical protein
MKRFVKVMGGEWIGVSCIHGNGRNNKEWKKRRTIISVTRNISHSEGLFLMSCCLIDWLSDDISNAILAVNCYSISRWMLLISLFLPYFSQVLSFISKQQATILVYRKI